MMMGSGLLEGLRIVCLVFFYFLLHERWRKTSMTKKLTWVLEHHLLLVVAEYLQEHPTLPDDPLKLQVRGLPVPEGTPPAPPVPRGWRINEIVPLHSSAMTGGGVSEDMLKDFQAAMQGQEPGSSSSKAPESSKKKKKDKVKKK
jgi:signal recognition particle subunit SRP19